MSKATHIAATFSLLALTVSCEKANLEETETEQPKTTHTIHFALSEERAFITEEPLFNAPATPTSTKKIYAINVYQKKDGAGSYKKYAYGLFDDPSLMSITLESGSLYRFECSESCDDQESVYHDADGYWSPYKHNGAPTPLDNQFVLSSKTNLDYIVEGSSKGWVNTSATDSIRCPRIYRYYATVSDFNPTESETISMELRRAIFGLRLIIAPPSDGTISLNYLFRNVTVAASDNTYDHEAVYAFNQISRACADGYSGGFPFELTWTRGDGTQVIGRDTITLKRNVMTTLEINVEGKTPSGFQITEENTEMESEKRNWTITEE